MNCCSAKGCEEFFSERVARRSARAYRRRGLAPEGRRIVELVRRRGVHGETVLEVGGGVGAIQIELVRAGAERATNVELSAAWEPYADELLREKAVAERVERRVLDFAARPGEVETADVVVLQRVVCCYPDYNTLVGCAADHAHKQLVLTFPRDVLLMRTGIRAVNLVQRLRRRAFRVYLHKPAAIVAVAESRGLRTTTREQRRFWELAEFARE